MAKFTKKIEIDASVDFVWKVLSEIGIIHEWNPGVLDSYTTSSARKGLHATRHCELVGDNYVDEKVVEWVPRKKMTMRIIDSDIPFENGHITFFLNKEHGSTTVTVQPDYELKYGVIGQLIDKFFMRKKYEEGMENLLFGLKEMCENSDSLYEI